MKTGKSAVSGSSGRWVKLAGDARAFVPDPLPPAITWSHELVSALSDADRLLGRLAGEGRRLPNPHILIRPFIRREAVLSSRIEGTQATLGELLAVEAGAVVDRSPDDLREVANYVVALEHGMKRLKHLPLSLRLVCELHSHLMRGVRGGHATPGEFRRTQNWIGRPGSTISTASYIPTPPDELMNCLGAWETFLHDRKLPPLVQIALAHYQFEAIHPFLDGNGRVGRLLITLFLIERGILPVPLLYLSAFFEANRRDYYDGLLSVTRHGAWEGWLIYFLNGVARQSEDALSRSERINQLLAAWREQLSGVASPAPVRVLDCIAGNPFVTIRGLEKALKTSYNTAARAVDLLVKKGVLSPVKAEARRDRVFCARSLLNILE
ncbi:MAG: Fic family protein [Kiritimatiellae bacterium]|nr:Fic family protein [Kiritimatiellia bacterium]